MLFKELYIDETGNIKQFGLGIYFILVYGLYKKWSWMPKLIIVLMAVILVFSFLVLLNLSAFRPGFLINIAAAIFVTFQIHRFREIERI